MTPIRLIVGLGNPGPKYANTRHNAGAWAVEEIAKRCNATLREDTKLSGFIAKTRLDDHDCWLFIPTTYMNESGRAVGAMAKYYKIKPEEILVAHDEIDFPPGKVRFKENGGHGGNNGVRDIISHLSSKTFHRLRIGVGHPGNPDDVANYVLKPPGNKERTLIDDSIYEALRVMGDYVAGNQQTATKELHTDS